MSNVREQAVELLRLLGLDTSIVAMDVVDALAEAHLLRSDDAHEHVCAGCGATTRERMPEQPRVWRSWDAEPGEDVRAAMDRDGFVWSRPWGEWQGVWDEIADYGPLVEVVLPAPVLS
jgi:hypothetical protein